MDGTVINDVSSGSSPYWTHQELQGRISLGHTAPSAGITTKRDSNGLRLEWKR